MTVKDNGPGIAANILEKLFIPAAVNSNGDDPDHLALSSDSGKYTSTNLSTKGGNHTGSGLSIVHSLAKELGGQVSCQTSHSDQAPQNLQGTEITVLLPLNPVANSNTKPGGPH